MSPIENTVGRAMRGTRLRGPVLSRVGWQGLTGCTGSPVLQYLPALLPLHQVCGWWRLSQPLPKTWPSIYLYLQNKMWMLSSPNHKAQTWPVKSAEESSGFVGFLPKIFLRITRWIRLVYQSKKAPVLPVCGHLPGGGLARVPWRLGTSKPAWPSPGLAGSWCWGPADGQESPESWIPFMSHCFFVPPTDLCPFSLALTSSSLASILSASRYGSPCWSKFPPELFFFFNTVWFHLGTCFVKRSQLLERFSSPVLCKFE